LKDPHYSSRNPQRYSAEYGLIKVALVSFFISLSWKIYSYSAVSSATCDKHFVGSVINVVDSSTPFSHLKKVKLDFHVSNRMKGTGGEYEEVYYPKDGLASFNIGDRYEVKLNNGLICSLRKV